MIQISGRLKHWLSTTYVLVIRSVMCVFFCNGSCEFYAFYGSKNGPIRSQQLYSQAIFWVGSFKSFNYRKQHQQIDLDDLDTLPKTISP